MNCCCQYMKSVNTKFFLYYFFTIFDERVEMQCYNYLHNEENEDE